MRGLLAIPVRRLSRLLSWTYLGAVAALAATLWGLGDRWWLATLALYGPRWIFALPLIPIALAGLLVDRRGLGLLAASALILAGPVLGLRVSPRSWRQTEQPAGALRIISANVEGGQQVDLDRILALEPDVVLFQECGPEFDARLRGVTGWQADTEPYVCALSRLPILARARQDPTEFWRVRGSDNVIRYELESRWGALSVTNVHLNTPRSGLQDAMRIRFWQAAGTIAENIFERDLESAAARRWVNRGRGPTIVGGDFNLPAESTIFRNHWGDLTDAFSAAGNGFGTTKHTRWIGIRIDHVLVGPGWEVRNAFVGPAVGSDHHPLVVDLEWRGKP